VSYSHIVIRSVTDMLYNHALQSSAPCEPGFSFVTAGVFLSICIHSTYTLIVAQEWRKGSLPLHNH